MAETITTQNATLDVIDSKGKKVGSVELPAATFDVQTNIPFVPRGSVFVRRRLNQTVRGPLFSSSTFAVGAYDAALAEVPLGIVSKCFLGAPYEVHTLDLSGRCIVQHYKTGEPLPADFEKARALARHNAYAMVEVYASKLLLIAADGTVTQL